MFDASIGRFLSSVMRVRLYPRWSTQHLLVARGVLRVSIFLYRTRNGLREGLELSILASSLTVQPGI